MPGRSFTIFTIFGVWGYTADVITQVKFQVNRSKGFGSTGTQNRVFPIDADRRPYNSQCFALPCYSVTSESHGSWVDQSRQSDLTT